MPGGIAWLGCEITEVQSGRYDHDLVFARVVAHGEGRLGEPPLLYSARHGWRITGEKAREKGVSVRDQLLARLADGQPSDGQPDGDQPGGPTT